MLVRLVLALVERDADAVVAYHVLALGLFAQVADLDLLAALLAPSIRRDHFGGIPSRTASPL